MNSFTPGETTFPCGPVGNGVLVVPIKSASVEEWERDHGAAAKGKPPPPGFERPFRPRDEPDGEALEQPVVRVLGPMPEASRAPDPEPRPAAPPPPARPETNEEASARIRAHHERCMRINAPRPSTSAPAPTKAA
jgi:hypothetical protein